MLADSFKIWQLEFINILRIKSLVKSQVVFVKGVSYIKLFIRSIGYYNITKAALAIGYRIKLYII